MSIGINNTTLNISDVVASLLSKDMRRKNMEGSTNNALVVKGRLFDKGKGKSSSRIPNLSGWSKTISKSLVRMTRKVWKCRKVGHYK